MFKECYIEIEQAIEENIKKLGIYAEFFVRHSNVNGKFILF